MPIQLLDKLFTHKADGLNSTEAQADVSFLDKGVTLVSTVALIALFVAYETLLDEHLHIQVLLENLLRL
ncbi:hypothetical protein [Shewanella kaireitica]|uniref:hypothetical protein n=1 Tax=Shewanella kaireitica TaxID=212021 RepID=UPI00200D5BE5|nr:hypothetical protein [Shewanella kaireitica]MCL1096102.1 hypothetical protein [Shewanella kaireitica]